MNECDVKQLRYFADVELMIGVFSSDCSWQHGIFIMIFPYMTGRVYRCTVLQKSDLKFEAWVHCRRNFRIPIKCAGLGEVSH
jgi:hypothetical protein